MCQRSANNRVAVIISSNPARDIFQAIVFRKLFFKLFLLQFYIILTIDIFCNDTFKKQ